MKKLLHISANQLPLPDQDHHTVRIWEELATAFDEYHIIGRASSNRFVRVQKDKIFLHLVPALGKRNRSFFLTSFYLFYLIRKHRITHMLSQSSIWGGFAASLASILFRIPVMVEIHGDVYFDYFTSQNLLKKLLGRISRFSLKKATKVRSLSSRMTEQLKEIGIVENVVTIPNRVDLILFAPPIKSYSLHDPVRIISIGRFVPQKGYGLAIKAIKQLDQVVPIRLSLIGGGRLKQEFQQLAQGDRSIELIEWIDQKTLIEKLGQADIYIQPSLPFLGEAMPRTILEAMAMGLPIIASEIAAIPGVIHNSYNGLLIPPGNPEALIRNLELLISDQKLREKLGKQAYRDARDHYEWQDVFKLYRNEIAGMK